MPPSGASLPKVPQARRAARSPLNRIIGIEQDEDRVVITTTDVHLPRRTGAAIHRTFQGTLDHHFDEVGYFIRVNWRRDS